MLTWIGLARELFVRLPLTQRGRLRMVRLAYSVAGALFSHTVHYQAWRRSLGEARQLAGLPAVLARVGPAPDPLAALSFPVHAQPLVSIVVPVRGVNDATLRCLAAIQGSAPACEYEVLVVDDAPDDSQPHCLARVPGLHYSKQPSQPGFVRQCNHASLQARGEYLLFLGRDTLVCPGAVDALLDVFRRRSEAGVAGAKLLQSDGRLRQAGGMVWRDGTVRSFGTGDDPQASCYSYLRETDYCSSAALMIPRVLFAALGGFAPELAPSDHGDADLAFQVRAAGHRVFFQPDAVVVQDEEAARGAEPGQDRAASPRRCEIAFRLKWREVLERDQYSAGASILLAAQRLRRRHTVLVIDQYVPRPDRDAGSRSIDQMMEGLQAAGWIVKFWPNNLWSDPEYTARLQARGIEVFHGEERYADRLESVLRELAPSLAAVVLNRPRIAYEHLETVRRATQAQVVYYGHDIHHLRLRLQNRVQPGTVSKREIAGLEWLERHLWRHVDVTYYPSRSEVAEVRACVPSARVALLPLFSYAAPHRVPPLAQRLAGKLLYVAGFSHHPNVDAALWFAREVLPLVRRAYPQARMFVVGSNVPAQIRALHGEAVEIAGSVSDAQLMAHYDSAMVSVVPLRWGGGIKGKVVESLQYGVPLVTTSVGADGLPLVDGVLRVADDAVSFAGQVLALLGSAPAWKAQSGAMQAYARRFFSQTALRQALELGFGASAALPRRASDIQAGEGAVGNMPDHQHDPAPYSGRVDHVLP